MVWFVWILVRYCCKFGRVVLFLLVFRYCVVNDFMLFVGILMFLIFMLAIIFLWMFFRLGNVCWLVCWMILRLFLLLRMIFFIDCFFLGCLLKMVVSLEWKFFVNRFLVRLLNFICLFGWMDRKWKIGFCWFFFFLSIKF